MRTETLKGLIENNVIEKARLKPQYTYCEDCRNGKEFKKHYKDELNAILGLRCVNCGSYKVE